MYQQEYDYDYYDGKDLKKPLPEDYYRTFFYKDGVVLSEEELKELVPSLKFPLPVKFNPAQKRAISLAGIVYQHSLDKEAFREAGIESEEILAERKKELKSRLLEELFDTYHSNLHCSADVIKYVYDYCDWPSSQRTVESFRKHFEFANDVIKVYKINQEK